ncbi:protein HEATR9-like [Amblyraja radiata]|uniref:protein HEATR9-like n=1 Tax=Amblyraja radiata TaxID=386614 RepID=UPI001401CBA1|nr:protein HEATR9-like [Amblyraja radiata]
MVTADVTQFGLKREQLINSERPIGLQTQEIGWTSEDPESILDQAHLISQDTVVYMTLSELRREEEKLRKRKLKHKFLMHQFRVTTFAVLLSVQKVQNKPKEIDPSTHPLQWERLKELLKSLSSSIVLERKDAVKALNYLNCNNKEIISALHNTVRIHICNLHLIYRLSSKGDWRLQTDKDCAVQCETMKALVTLGECSKYRTAVPLNIPLTAIQLLATPAWAGYWDEDLITKFVDHLSWSSGTHLEELIVILRGTLRDLSLAPDHQNLEFKAKEKLHLLLTALMTAPHSKDMIPVHAAASLCYLNRNDQDATEYIMSYLYDGHTYQTNLALDVVIRYLGIYKTFPIQVVLKQIQTSRIYKHRLEALDLLVVVGTRRIMEANMYHTVANVLMKKLWEDPVVAVSRRAAMIVNMLGMKRGVWDDVEEQLEDNDALARGRAVISLGILGLPNRKVLNTLLEMLESDISQYVRFQIMRTFAKLHLKDDQVKLSLMNRQLGGGPLAREADRQMKILEKSSSNQKMTLPAQAF